ncbi:HipA-like protein [Acidipila rosea]|uniref:HipA-like protein n=1 Tax=Acidipila rosea TaxID=768535 RepID=A0A4R1L1Y2_9BACT|nr:HipA family kinase [Acidipila rosea]TCK71986.1 HipA-like protein [Acidipila rosea]
MAVLAVQAIRRMRGGAQGHLMLGADGEAYVVKFQNNPQHIRVLANELMATKLARALGLTAPECDVVEVTEWLIENTAELSVEHGRERQRCVAGLQFGSRLVGGLMPGQTMDYLPEEQLREVKNLGEFAGMLALDKWTCNSNGRQAVFHKRPREKRYQAAFIDQGYCFNAGEWKYVDAPLRGVYARNLVYEGITGWDSFEPWLSRLEEFDPGIIWGIAETVPPEWYGGDPSAIERLVEGLMVRRGRVRELIGEFRESSRQPFPKWGKAQENVVKGGFGLPGWADDVSGPVM